MYLKVYYKNGKDATVEEVKAALPTDMSGLTVDNDLQYPCVEFPDGAKYQDVQRVQKALQQQGFETE